MRDRQDIVTAIVWACLLAVAAVCLVQIFWLGGRT